MATMTDAFTPFDEELQTIATLDERLHSGDLDAEALERIDDLIRHRSDRRELIKGIGKAGIAGALALALGEGFRIRQAAAYSYNPATYVTPIAFRCYPVTQWYGPGTASHISGENAKAIDIGCPSGTPVYAPKDGVIAFEGWEGVGGIVCRINHADGCQSILAHLSSTIINNGDRVRGSYTKIGYSGATGNVTGPHLHWALKIQGTSTGLALDKVPGVSRSQICP
jgi:murein DD-endopeptidase MepM/ murein hydrolase activator NlpD